MFYRKQIKGFSGLIAIFRNLLKNALCQFYLNLYPGPPFCNNSQFLYINQCTSGILHSSSGFLPQTWHSPIWFFSMGLFWAQEPLKGSPLKIYLIFMAIMAINKTAKARPKVSNVLMSMVSSSYCVIIYNTKITNFMVFYK